MRWAFKCVESIMMRWGLGPRLASAAKMRSKTPSRLPADEMGVKRLLRPVAFGSVLPLQAVPEHIDNAADDARGTPCATGKNGEIIAIWRSLSKNSSSRVSRHKGPVKSWSAQI